MWHGFMPWEAPYRCWEYIQGFTGNAVSTMTWDSVCSPYAIGGAPLLMAAMEADMIFIEREAARLAPTPAPTPAPTWNSPWTLLLWILLDPSSQETELQRQCYQMLEAETKACGAWKDRAKIRICQSQAMERYSNCLRGKPLPPPFMPTGEQSAPSRTISPMSPQRGDMGRSARGMYR